MDRKTITVVVICFALMLFGSQVINKMFPPTPLGPGETNREATAASPLTNAPAVTAADAPPTTTTATTTTPPKPTAQYSGAEETLVITNADARYTFTSHGGGLKTIELLKFPETITRRSKKENGTNGVATLNTPHAPPVLSILGNDSVQDDGGFTLTGTTTGVRAEKSLANGLRLVKDFQIGTNHLIHATVRLENTSAQPLTLAAQEWIIGTATPMGPDDHGEAVGLMWYNGASKTEILGSWFDNKTLGCFPGTPRPEYRVAQSNVVWTAVHNQFFVLAAMFTFTSNSASAVVARPVHLPRPGEGWASSSDNPAPKGFQTALVFPESTLPAGQAIERQINIYAGPKEYRTLAHIGAQFKNNVDVVMGYDGFFGFFSKVLLLGMNWLHHTLSLPYGWAIIAITIIIKGLFWPLTAASTRSMKRLQALQPQMTAIREKYKDDPMKMNKKVMEFMKENKVSPLGGCLPMLLQMPVFIGFFFMIRTAIELRGASWLWVPDLSKADTLFFIPGLGIPFNLLPLLMGGTMLWQARLTPPSPGMDPTQAKMMRYMPLIFIVFLYNYSAGLALYWTVNNLLSVLQTKLTKTATPAAVTAATPASVLTPASKKKK